MTCSAGLAKVMDGGPPPAMTVLGDRASTEAVILGQVLTPHAHRYGRPGYNDERAVCCASRIGCSPAAATGIASPRLK
jgi:hypothetical protein